MKTEQKCILHFLKLLAIVFVITAIAIIFGGLQSVRNMINLTILIQWFFDIITGFFMLFLVNTSGMQGGLVFAGVAIALEISAVMIEYHFTSQDVDSQDLDQPEIQARRKYLRYLMYFFRFLIAILVIVAIPVIFGGTQEVQRMIGTIIVIQWYVSILVGFNMLLLVNMRGIGNGLVAIDFALVFQIITIMISFYLAYIEWEAEKFEVMRPKEMKKLEPEPQFFKAEQKSFMPEPRFKPVGPASKPEWMLARETLSPNEMQKPLTPLPKTPKQIFEGRDEVQNVPQKPIQKPIESKMSKWDAREYIKNIARVYDEITFKNLALKTNWNTEDLEMLVENMIIEGELKARIITDSIIFLNEEDIAEKRKMEKLNKYLLSVLKIRLARGEISEEEYERLIQKIKN